MNSVESTRVQQKKKRIYVYNYDSNDRTMEIEIMHELNPHYCLVILVLLKASLQYIPFELSFDKKCFFVLLYYACISCNICFFHKGESSIILPATNTSWF